MVSNAARLNQLVLGCACVYECVCVLVCVGVCVGV